MYWVNVALLVVFAVHLVVFGKRAWASRRALDTAVALLFFFLVVSFSLRIWSPDWQLAGIEAFRLARYAAWLLALFTVPRLLWTIIQRFRTPT